MPPLDLLGSILPYSLKPWEWTRGAWSVKEMPDLTGKVAFCTGANGGVGLETCLQLFNKGATVLMGCRSEPKFNIARDIILARADSFPSRGSLTYVQADTATIRTSLLAAETISELSEINRLDIFIACAGRGSSVGPLNEDGVEPFFQTNCLGHLAMLQDLLPLIIKTSKSSTESCRIVFVSSVAEQWSSIPRPFAVPPTFASWDDINSAKRGERGLYSASKLGQILTMKRLDRELASENISCLSIHPGELNNQFVAKMIPLRLHRPLQPLLRLLLLNGIEGARACLFAASATEVDERSLRGSHIVYPACVKEPSRLASDAALADRLWDLQIALIRQCRRNNTQINLT